MRTFASVLAFAASTFAYTVTKPDNSTGFSTSGSNTVTWTRVSTDPQNFTVVLVNKSKFPNYSQVLSALVVGGDSGGSTQVNPPSTGWPTGDGYQINLAADAQDLNTLLAQSVDFSFHAPTANSSSSGSLAASSTLSLANTVSPVVQPSASGSTTPSASDGDVNPPSTSDTTTQPTGNGAATMSIQGALFGLVALVGAALA